MHIAVVVVVVVVVNFRTTRVAEKPSRTVEPKRPSEMNVEMNKRTGEQPEVNRPPGLAQREWSEANLFGSLAFEGSVFPSQSDSTPAASEHGPIERNVGFVVL